MVALLSDVLEGFAKRRKAATESGRALLPEAAIRESIKDSVNYKLDESPPESASMLRIFATSRQNTWLVATPKRLYCILDDVRKPNPHINWSMGREQLLDGDGALTIGITSRDKSQHSGLVDIGPKHKNWYFSKKLFQSHSIDSAVEGLIRNAMA